MWPLITVRIDRHDRSIAHAHVVLSRLTGSCHASVTSTDLAAPRHRHQFPVTWLDGLTSNSPLIFAGYSGYGEKLKSMFEMVNKKSELMLMRRTTASV